MLDFETYKKSLGRIAETLTDDEIDKRRYLADQIADVFFDIWLKKKNQITVPVPSVAINEGESAR